MEPKHYAHAAILQTIADVNGASAIWDTSMRNKYPYSLSEAIEKLGRLRREHPEWVTKEEYQKEIDGPPCPRCKPTGEFPLAPKEKIFEIWGYV